MKLLRSGRKKGSKRKTCGSVLKLRKETWDPTARRTAAVTEKGLAVDPEQQHMDWTASCAWPRNMGGPKTKKTRPKCGGKRKNEREYESCSLQTKRKCFPAEGACQPLHYWRSARGQSENGDWRPVVREGKQNEGCGFKLRTPQSDRTLCFVPSVRSEAGQGASSGWSSSVNRRGFLCMFAV